MEAGGWAIQLILILFKPRKYNTTPTLTDTNTV